MKLFALILLGRLIGQPVCLDAAPVLILYPAFLLLAVTAVIVVAALVLEHVIRKKKGKR